MFLLAEEERKKILDLEATARTETAKLVQQQMERRKQQQLDVQNKISGLNDAEQLPGATQERGRGFKRSPKRNRMSWRGSI